MNVYYRFTVFGFPSTWWHGCNVTKTNSEYCFQDHKHKADVGERKSSEHAEPTVRNIYNKQSFLFRRKTIKIDKDKIRKTNIGYKS